MIAAITVIELFHDCCLGKLHCKQYVLLEPHNSQTLVRCCTLHSNLSFFHLDCCHRSHVDDETDTDDGDDDVVVVTYWPCVSSLAKEYVQLVERVHCQESSSSSLQAPWQGSGEEE